MTDFERVMELAGELTSVTIVSDDHRINISIEVDYCDVNDDETEMSIGDLDGNEFCIRKEDIENVKDNVVKVKGYTLTFEIAR